MKKTTNNKGNGRLALTAAVCLLMSCVSMTACSDSANGTADQTVSETNPPVTTVTTEEAPAENTEA